MQDKLGYSLSKFQEHLSNKYRHHLIIENLENLTPEQRIEFLSASSVYQNGREYVILHLIDINTDLSQKIKNLISKEVFEKIMQTESKTQETILHATLDLTTRPRGFIAALSSQTIKSTIHKKNSKKRTPFHLIAIKHTESLSELITLLYEYGILDDLYAKDEDNCTAFEYLVKNNTYLTWESISGTTITISANNQSGLSHEILRILKDRPAISPARLSEVAAVNPLNIQAHVILSNHTYALSPASLYNQTVSRINEILNSLLEHNIFDEQHKDYRGNLASITKQNFDKLPPNEDKSPSTNKYILAILKLLYKYLTSNDLLSFVKELESKKTNMPEELIFLGICYVRGNGVLADSSKAADFFFSAHKFIMENLESAKDEKSFLSVFKDGSSTDLSVLKDLPFANLEALANLSVTNASLKENITAKIAHWRKFTVGSYYLTEAAKAQNGGKHSEAIQYYLSAITTPFNPRVPTALNEIFLHIEQINKQGKSTEKREEVLSLLDATLAASAQATEKDDKNVYQNFFDKVQKFGFPPFSARAVLYLREAEGFLSSLGALNLVSKKSKYLTVLFDYAKYLETTINAQDNFIDIYGDVALTALDAKSSDKADVKAKEDAVKQLQEYTAHQEHGFKASIYLAFTLPETQRNTSFEQAKSKNLAAYKATLQLIVGKKHFSEECIVIADKELHSLGSSQQAYNPEAAVEEQGNAKENKTMENPQANMPVSSEPSVTYPSLESSYPATAPYTPVVQAAVFTTGYSAPPTEQPVIFPSQLTTPLDAMPGNYSATPAELSMPPAVPTTPEEAMKLVPRLIEQNYQLQVQVSDLQQTVAMLTQQMQAMMAMQQETLNLVKNMQVSNVTSNTANNQQAVAMTQSHNSSNYSSFWNNDSSHIEQASTNIYPST